MANIAYAWSPEASDNVRQKYMAGKSIALIAQEMGTSRDIIARKVRKMKLPTRKVTQSAIAAPRFPVPTRAPVPLLKATAKQCHSIHDQRGPDGLAMVCGEPVTSGSTWCAYHRDLFHQPNPWRAD